MAGPKRMRLTDAAVSRLRPGEREYTVWDTTVRGLGVRVRTTGGKSWVHLRRSESGSRRVSFGPVETASVAEARRACLARQAAPEPEGRAARKDAVPLLRDFVAGEWRKANYDRYKPSTRKGVRSLLNTRVLPAFGSNRALRLNRVPLITARILRHLASAQVLGRNISVVGTNSLYLYEALAGVQLRSDLLATNDVDLLWDARQSLSLSVSDFRREGVMGYLKRADQSFRRSSGQYYRAINQNGFMVDLIHPIDDLLANTDDRVNEEDLVGTGIEGLEWLVNAPKLDGVVIGEDGIPLRCWSVDPRAFALHKAWVAGRADREPVRRIRDHAQSREVARIAKHYLGMEMSDPALSALPSFMRRFADGLDLAFSEENP